MNCPAICFICACHAHFSGLNFTVINRFERNVGNSCIKIKNLRLVSFVVMWNVCIDNSFTFRVLNWLRIILQIITFQSVSAIYQIRIFYTCILTINEFYEYRSFSTQISPNILRIFGISDQIKRAFTINGSEIKSLIMSPPFEEFKHICLQAQPTQASVKRTSNFIIQKKKMMTVWYMADQNFFFDYSSFFHCFNFHSVLEVSTKHVLFFSFRDQNCSFYELRIDEQFNGYIHSICVFAYSFLIR